MEKLEAFAALNKQIEDSVKAFQKTIQDAVIATIELEIKATKEEIRELFATSIFQIASLFLICNARQVELGKNVHALAITTIKDNQDIIKNNIDVPITIFY